MGEQSRKIRKGNQDAIVNTTSIPLPSRVVALDPGRKNIVNGIIFDSESLNTLGEKKPKKFQTAKVTRAEWRSISGSNEQERLISGWRHEKNQATLLEQELLTPTAKTANTITYLLFVKHQLKNENIFFDFYMQKKFSKLRWRTFIQKQRAWSIVEKRVLGKKYKKERPLIIYGDCSRNNTFVVEYQL